jgi:hypothetical protein
MKVVKLTKKYSIDEEGNLYKNGEKVIVNKRMFLRVGKEVQQLAYWIGINFVPGYFDGAVIDHIDSHPENNNPSNLQWITQSENMLKRLDFLEGPKGESREVRKYFEENGKTKHQKKEIVRELVWKLRHDGKFRFESDSDWSDFAVK